MFAPAASCVLPERIGLAAAEDLLLSGAFHHLSTKRPAIGLLTEVADDPEAAALGLFRSPSGAEKRRGTAFRHAGGAGRHLSNGWRQNWRQSKRYTCVN